MPDNEFKCALCHKDLDKDYILSSREEMNAESMELFGITDQDEDAETVCDDCFKQMVAILPPAEFNAAHAALSALKVGFTT